uniref:Uncharacterized protein n=1 Tax=Glossina pallidipes TaxID=7398 RepID=A0A1B0A774_GLOPL
GFQFLSFYNSIFEVKQPFITVAIINRRFRLCVIIVQKQIVNFFQKRNEKIAAHCTVCGAKVKEILERCPKVREYELGRDNFATIYNFVFGIQEHIDLGIKYDPSIGYNVAYRQRKSGKVGYPLRVTKEDAMK